VFSAYDSSNIKSQIENLRIILVCPTRDNFEEYVQRFKQRGNSDEFIARREKEFSNLVDLFEHADNYEKIIMRPGQYLSEALEEYGINLNSKSSILKN